MSLIGLLILFGSPAHAGSYEIIASRDSFLDQAKPDDNFQSAANLKVTAKSGAMSRAVFYFELSSIPAGEIVTSANLRLFVESATVSAVGVHRITDSWTESGVTWTNTAADFDAAQEASFIPSTKDVYLAISITSLVREWRAGTANHGVMLVSEGPADESKYSSREALIASTRPRLFVTTVSPPNIATTKVSQVMHDPVNGTVNPKLIPGATVRYTITATNTGTGNADNAIVSDPVPPNITYAPGSLTLAATSLTDASDADAGTYDSSTRTIEVQVGILAAGGSSATITLEAVVN